MSLSCFQAASSKRKEITLQSNLYKAVPNIENLDLGFSKHWKSVFRLFQTLEFFNLAFPSIVMLSFGFSKHWKSGVRLFPNIGIL